MASKQSLQEREPFPRYWWAEARSCLVREPVIYWATLKILFWALSLTAHDIRSLNSLFGILEQASKRLTLRVTVLGFFPRSSTKYSLCAILKFYVFVSSVAICRCCSDSGTTENSAL